MSSSYASFALMILLVVLISVQADEASEMVFQDGLPSSILCLRALPYGTYAPELSDCRITKDGEEIFKTNVTREKHQRGEFFTANSSWNGSAINVSAEFKGKRHSRVYIINVIIPAASPCNSDTINNIYRPTATIGEVVRLHCPVPKTMREDLTEDEMEEFHVTWYRDCIPISRNDSKYFYEKLTPTQFPGEEPFYKEFNHLRVLKPVMNDNGAEFKCIVSYRNSSFEALKLKLEVTPPKNYVGPELLEGSSKYVVSRGATVNLTCSWKYSQIADVTTIWEKSGRRICAIDIPPCSRVITVAKKNSASPFNEMTSVLTLTNVNANDVGVYSCIIQHPTGLLSANTSITILPESKATVTTIVSATVLAVLVVIMVTILIYFWKRIEILYIYKKMWGKYVETENPITYLIYGDDSCIIDNDRNPVNDVTSWLTTRGVTFCDHSKGKEWSDTGAPIADRSIALMEQCLSLTIFLTPSLLNDNTLELFKTYSGFQDNIRKKNFPVVFVCSKEFEKRITKLARTGDGINDDDLKAGTSQETYRTFLKFMRRNIVIHWFPQNNLRFYRSLYVALPKVAIKKPMPIQEA